MKNARNIKRELEMCEAYMAGETLRHIGERYGFSRERARQLITRHGLNASHGGQHVTSTVNQIERAISIRNKRIAKEESRYMKYLGCSKDVFAALTGAEWSWTIHTSQSSRNPGVAYMNQKRYAEYRGIEWRMTFPEWWKVWQDSGHWEQRGRGQGYCMGRYGDTGPYSPDNVYICTIGQNFSDSYLTKPASHRIALRRQRQQQGTAA